MTNLNAHILRQAAFELHSVSEGSVVKNAFIVKKIVNWFKQLKDPAYKESLEKLQAESPKIQHLTETLQTELNKLNSSISNSDPIQYGNSLSVIKPIITELATELSSLEKATTDVIQEAPVEGVIDEKGNRFNSEEEYIRYVGQGYRKDPKIMDALQRQLPADLDVPIKDRIAQPVQSFNWFKQFSPQDVEITHNAANNIINQSIDALVTGFGALKAGEAEEIVTQNADGLLSNLQNAVLNGLLITYTYPANVGGKVNKRTANQMFVLINAGPVNIPNTDYWLKFPEVYLTDKYASANPDKELNLWGVKNVKFLRGSRKPEVKPEPELDIPVTVESNAESNIAKFGLAKQPSSSQLDQWARGVLIRAFQKEMGRMPTEPEIQTIQAVAKLESNYGRGWRGHSDSNNWGAIQSKEKPVNGVCPVGTFPYGDTSPTETGANIKYQACFKSYPTPEDGAADLVRTVYKTNYKNRGQRTLEAVNNGDLDGFSEAMYDSSYYQGHGKTREERIQNHRNAIGKLITNINKNVGEQNAFEGVAPAGNDFLQQEVDNLMRALYAEGPVETIVKNAILNQILPTTKLLLSVGSVSDPIHIRTRYAHVLSKALRNEINAEVSIHTNGKVIEIECSAAGSAKNVKSAVSGVCTGISDVFEMSTKHKISNYVFENTKSSFALIDNGFTEKCFRKFAFEVMKNVK